MDTSVCWTRRPVLPSINRIARSSYSQPSIPPGQFSEKELRGYYELSRRRYALSILFKKIFALSCKQYVYHNLSHIIEVSFFISYFISATNHPTGILSTEICHGNCCGCRSIIKPRKQNLLGLQFTRVCHKFA
jgi:hypothetical protein